MTCADDLFLFLKATTGAIIVVGDVLLVLALSSLDCKIPHAPTNLTFSVLSSVKSAEASVVSISLWKYSASDDLRV